VRWLRRRRRSTEELGAVDSVRFKEVDSVKRKNF
jgi:hypothetical protein